MDSKYFVPFETAKQLKEKGYPQGWELEDYCAAPTYHEVVDWLEGKGIVIGTGKARGKWYCSIDSDTDDLTTELYPTREAALNVAILKALEMI